MNRITRVRLKISNRRALSQSSSFHSRLGEPEGLFCNSKGMALVLALMVLAIIFAMVVEFSYEIYINTSALHNWQISQRLSLLAKSGVQLAAKTAGERALRYPYTYPGVLELSPPNPLDGYEGILSLRVEDESSKFNLRSLVFPNGTVNGEARNSLIRLLKALGLSPEIADRILDWIDPDREPRLQDSENIAKNRHLDSLDEILLIPGIGKENYERLLPYVTIYGSDLININGAQVPVLMSLSDSIDKGMAERVVRYRENLPFEKPADILKVAGFDTIGQNLMGRIAVQGTSFRIVSTAKEGDITRVIESIIETPSERALLRYWRET